MPTYLYCLRSSSDSMPAELRGIDGAPVRALGSNRLAWGTAWVSDVAVGRVEPTLARVRAHDAVCAAALALGETPLPMRFGHVYADDGACTAALAQHSASLAARLARVAGAVEFRIVVGGGGRPAAAVAAAGGAGRAYLERVGERVRREDALRARCETVVAALRAALSDPASRPAETGLRDERGCSLTDARTAVVAHLVARQGVDRYRHLVATALDLFGDDCVLLGPLPPYSFAGDE